MSRSDVPLPDCLQDEWYRRAELALSKSDDELAREALSRRKAFQDNADMLRSQLEQQGKAVQTIIGNMRMLESKLAEAKMKKDTLKARAQSAKSARAVNDMVAGLNTSSSLGAFEKMEEKVLSLEAQAEAATLVSSLPVPTKLSRSPAGAGLRLATSQFAASLVAQPARVLAPAVCAARGPRQPGVQVPRAGGQQCGGRAGGDEGAAGLQEGGGRGERGSSALPFVHAPKPPPDLVAKRRTPNKQPCPRRWLIFSVLLPVMLRSCRRAGLLPMPSTLSWTRCGVGGPLDGPTEA